MLHPAYCLLVHPPPCVCVRTTYATSGRLSYSLQRNDMEHTWVAILHVFVVGDLVVRVGDVRRHQQSVVRAVLVEVNVVLVRLIGQVRVALGVR